MTKTETATIEVIYPGLYGTRLPRVSDAITPGRCANCNQPHGYGEVIKRVTDGALVCSYDCRSTR